MTEAADADTDHECRGDAQPLRITSGPARRGKAWTSTQFQMSSRGMCRSSGGRLYVRAASSQQLVEAVAVLFGHDSYSFAKSASAARSCARADRQSALAGSFGDTERLGDLRVGVAFQVVHDQRGAIDLGQRVDGLGQPLSEIGIDST